MFAHLQLKNVHIWLCSVNKTKLYLAPGSHLKVYTDSFQFSAADAWNTLPAHVRESQSIGVFKAQ